MSSTFGDTCFDLYSGTQKEFREYLNDTDNVVYGSRSGYGSVDRLICGRRSKFLPLSRGISTPPGYPAGYEFPYYTISVDGHTLNVDKHIYENLMNPKYQIFLFTIDTEMEVLGANQVISYTKGNYFRTKSYDMEHVTGPITERISYALKHSGPSKGLNLTDAMRVRRA